MLFKSPLQIPCWDGSSHLSACGGSDWAHHSACRLVLPWRWALPQPSSFTLPSRSPSVACAGGTPWHVCVSKEAFCLSLFRWGFQCVWGVCGSSCCKFQPLVTHWEWLWMWDPGEEEASEHDCDGRGFAEEGKVGVILTLGVHYSPLPMRLQSDTFTGVRRGIPWKRCR